MKATFERFEIRMTRAQAEMGGHHGPCDDDVCYLVTVPAIKRQLDGINPNDLRAELREYGAWSADELADDYENRMRIVWIAAGNIKEGN